MTGLAEFCITTLKSQFRGISNLITIDRRASKPLYQQIYDSFRSRIIRGEFRAGDLVPSSRELARESRISRLPVLTAYAQLLAEGYFESRIGAGTFISSSLPSRSTGSSPGPARGQRLLSAQAAALPKYERPSWAESLGAIPSRAARAPEISNRDLVKACRALFAPHASESIAIR